MTAVLDALARALRDLFSLRVLWVAVWPMLAALLLWLALGVMFWGTFSGWIELGLDAIGIQTWLTGLEPAWIANGIQALLHLMLFVPLVMLTALVLTAIFGMDAMVDTVGERFFPQLEKRRGGGVIGSTANAFVAVVVYLGLWIVTLPLWLLGPVGALIPLVTAGYLNQRLFRYDALAIHADAVELKAVIEQNRGGLWALGILLGLVQFVPLLNFFAPVFTGLAFIHYCLGKLRERREQSGALPV